MANDYTSVLDRIEAKLDKINGRVADHDRWIAARAPVCANHAKGLQAVNTTVAQHQTYIDTRRGSRSGMGETMKTVLTLLTLGIAIVAIILK